MELQGGGVAFQGQHTSTFFCQRGGEAIRLSSSNGDVDYAENTYLCESKTDILV